MGKFTVMSLTGAELAALERHTGKLERVATDPRLIRVPEEFVKFARGVEEQAGLEVAKATFSRGVGHAEAAADALEQRDAIESDSQTGVPADDSK